MLISWTLVMWVAMYATRIPAILKANLPPEELKEKSAMNAILPLSVRQIADNYNHLHEQPVIFYGLCMYSHLMETADAINITIAWIYVVLRIIHSLIQSTVNIIPLRFGVFVMASACLFLLTVRNWLAL